MAMMFRWMNKLHQLHRRLEKEYYFYRSGAISQKEYLKRVKPIDMQITQLEMSTLQGTPAWIEAFSRHTLKQAY
jgi:hypothetical protein